jgi:hypothetical protein
VASIHSIQVKEYIQTLIEENKLRVDKIGSGNWYWSFGSDEKYDRERQGPSDGRCGESPETLHRY